MSLVLVVDDNEINAMLMENMLSRYGVDVELAEDGQKAILLVTAKKYDMIFIDRVMPFMDGIETTKRIKKLPNGKIPIVAVSADFSDGILEQFMQAGAVDALDRPMNKKALEICLFNHLYFGSAQSKQGVREIVCPPDVEFDEACIMPQKSRHELDCFAGISGLNLEKALKSSSISNELYYKLAKTALKDLNIFHSQLMQYQKDLFLHQEDLCLAAHSLKSILLSLGAFSLSECAASLEAAVKVTDIDGIGCSLSKFTEQLLVFLQELNHAVDAYDIGKTAEPAKKSGMPAHSSNDQIRKELIRKLQIHLDRFEITYILETLHKLLLVSSGAAFENVQKAIGAAEEFRYEEVRDRMNSFDLS